MHDKELTERQFILNMAVSVVWTIP